MPTYEYACRDCEEHLEVQQSFSDPALTECPSCGGPLRKVFGNIAITFKGSGFYKTDSRATNGKGKTAAKSPADGGSSGSSDTSSSSSSEGSGSTSSGSDAGSGSASSESSTSKPSGSDTGKPSPKADKPSSSKTAAT